MENQNTSLQNQTSRIFNRTSHVNNFTDHDDEIIDWVNFYVYAAILPTNSFIGIVANTLSCVVLFHMSKISSFYVYLAFLSLSDLAMLTASGIFHLLAVFEFSFKINVEALCSLNFVLAIIFSQLSSWITVAVTSDRYVAVCHPFDAIKFCTKRRALIYICTVFLVIVTINIPIMFCLKWNEKDKSCITPEFTTDYCNIYSSYIDMCSYVLIPFCLICALNTLTIRGIYRAASMRRKVTAGNENAASSIPSIKDSTMRRVNMLFTVTAFFIATFLPFFIVSVYRIIYNKSFDTVYELIPATVTIAYMTTQLNHSLNIIFYGLLGKRFRETFLKIFRCRRFVGRSRD